MNSGRAGRYDFFFKYIVGSSTQIFHMDDIKDGS